MDSSEIVLLMETVKMAFLLAVPILGGALIVGFATGTAQAVTTVHDQSISTVPKLVVVALILFFAGPWMMGRLVEFTLALLSDLGRFVH